MTDVDALVIGSGFGGSVTAARLAQDGWSVLVLERGRPYPRAPSTYAALHRQPLGSLHAALRDVRRVVVHRHQRGGGQREGGGSLIYANVSLRKPPETFARDESETWPLTRADLDPHYDAVERVLTPTPYPSELEAVTPKTPRDA